MKNKLLKILLFFAAIIVNAGVFFLVFSFALAGAPWSLTIPAFFYLVFGFVFGRCWNSNLRRSAVVLSPSIILAAVMAYSITREGNLRGLIQWIVAGVLIVILFEGGRFLGKLLRKQPQ